MAKIKQKSNSNTGKTADSVYFLKLLLFFILGAVWIRTEKVFIAGLSGFPIGLIIGLVFASHEHFQIDRKIEFVVLIVATILSYIAPVGVVLQF